MSREGERQPGESLWPLVLAAAGLFPLLAALRHLDDNSLTSWDWVLNGRDAVGIWVLHLAVVAAAAALSRRPLPAGWRVPAAAGAAFAAGLAVALAGEPEAVIDAARYFAQAKHLATRGVASFAAAWGGEVPAWTDLPLPALLYGAGFRLFGEHRAAAQGLAAGLLALTALATAGIARRLGDGAGGAAAGALLLAAPVLLVNTPLLMADLPATGAVAVAAWALLAAMEDGGAARVAAAAAALGCALLAKYSTWALLAGVAGAALAAEALRGRRAAVRRGAAACALGALAPAAYALAHPGVLSRQLALLGGFQAEGLRRWGESHASTFLFQTHPLLAGLALVALGRAWRRRDPRAAVAAAAPLLLVLLHARRSRYLLPALPFVAVLAAQGLEALGGERRRRFAVLAAAGFSLVTVFALFVPFLRWTNAANLAAAGAFLDERGVRAVEVFAAPTPGLAVNPEVAVPLLDYHTAAQVLLRESAAVRPPAGELAASSFRFTWEAPIPAWNRAPADPVPGAAIALVTGDPGGTPPAALTARVGLRPPDAVFARDAVYRFRTDVYVWLP